MNEQSNRIQLVVIIIKMKVSYLSHINDELTESGMNSSLLFEFTS